MITLNQVTFYYPNAAQPALHNINLKIQAGEFALVTGHSGAGKSTLLRLLNGLVPHFTGGALSGRLQVCGKDPVRASPKEMSRLVGFVFQDPETQFVMDRVEDDLAFTLENARLDRAEIDQRITAAMHSLNLLHLRKRRIDTLSGGERQRAAIAAALLYSPKILVLDEPTSQLDPQSAEEVLKAIVALHRSLGLTVLISEHRLERILPAANRLISFNSNGEIVSGPPRQVIAQCVTRPPVVSLGLKFGWQPLPLTVAEAQPFARTALYSQPQAHSDHSQETRSAHDRSPILQVNNVSVEINKKPIIQNISLDLYPGEVVALIGPNGCGKTTLLRAITGLLRLSAGDIVLQDRSIARAATETICRQVGYLPQDPNSLLFADRVIDELQITLQNHSLQSEAGWPEALLHRFGLQEFASRYPRDLSAGQRQRIALCAILVTRPNVLLLDEPTRGMDAAAKDELQRLLSDWRSEGKAILLVTHDVELTAGIADRVVRMEAGSIIQNGSPRETLRQLKDHAPQVMQLFPNCAWRTVDDIYRCYP